MFFMLEDKEQSEEDKELERKEKAKQRRSRGRTPPFLLLPLYGKEV